VPLSWIPVKINPVLAEPRTAGENVMKFSSHYLFPLLQSWERNLAPERVLERVLCRGPHAYEKGWISCL